MALKKQQEAILAAVCTLRNHPTAEEIYTKLKKENPRLSLGTVYRNLSAFAQKGDILRITIPEAGDRFDFRLDKHEHLLCDQCGRVFDINADVTIDLRDTDIKVRDYSLLFHGICAGCRQNDAQ